MKNFKEITTKTLLLILFIIIFIIEAKAQKHDFYVNFDCSLSSFQAKTIPDYFRNIPVYKGDGGSTGLISRSQFEFLIMPSLDIGAQFNLENNCAFHFGFVFGASGDSEARNYTNAPGTNQRGNGAALTFSGISIQGPMTLLGAKPIVPFFFVTPKIAFEFPLSKKNYYPRISIDASYQLLTAINGWDRYNSNECNDFRTLAHVIPLGISYNIGFNDSGSFSTIGVGLKYFLNFQTSYGKEFGANIYPVGIFLNAGI